jgi:MerR family redox-sensitive transcriptional activator SoxR
MENQGAQLTIGEVARQAGMRASRIRYYETHAILPQPERVSGMRRYAPDVVRRLEIIDLAQRVGFTLDEIRQLLGPGTRPVHDRIRELAIDKLPDIEDLIERATDRPQPAHHVRRLRMRLVRRMQHLR